MGFWGVVVAARGASEHDLQGSGFEIEGRCGIASDWLWARSEATSQHEDLICAASLGGAAVGAYVLDSDVALIVAASAGELRARLVLGGHKAYFQPPSAPAPAQDLDGFVQWWSAEIRPISPEELSSLLEADFVFAEEAFDDVLDSLGLPQLLDPPAGASGQPPLTAADVGCAALVGYVAPMSSMDVTDWVLGRDVAWTEQRFVPGISEEGTIGIWDRSAPDGPCAAFPATVVGWRRLDAALQRLRGPLRVQLAGLERYFGMTDVEHQGGAYVDVGGRRLQLADAPFVAGRDEAGFGVWSAERPAEGPAERFADGQAAKDSARVSSLRSLLERTQVTGGRWYAAGSERKEMLHLEGQKSGKGIPSVRRVWPRLIVEAHHIREWTAPAVPGKDGEPAAVSAFAFHSVREPVRSDHLYFTGYHASLADARAAIAQDIADGAWIRVPDEVGRTLLETADWVANQLSLPREEGRRSWFRRGGR